MRKTKSVLLALALLFAMSTRVSAYTKGQIVTFGDHTYRVINPDPNNATLCYLGSKDSFTGELVIPEIVDDGVDVKFTVTEIGGSDAYYCRKVTSVKIPETVTKINSPAFAGASLSTIYLPQYLTEIAKTSFYKTSQSPVFTVHPDNSAFWADDDGVLYNKEKTILRYVPSAISLEDDTTYTVNPSVKSIAYDAFLNNSRITKIVLPPNLESIDMGYPTIVHGIGNLKMFEVAEGGQTKFKAIEGVLFKGDTLVAYPQGKTTKNYSVPPGIKAIGRYAINSNSHMETIDMKDVETLNTSSIVDCSQLTSITLPKSLKENTLEGAISSCKKVKEYIVPEDSEHYYGENGVVFTKDKATLLLYPPAKEGATYDIPGDVTTIATYAFRASQNLTSLKIPNNVSTIAYQAFREMAKLEKIEFDEPSSVTAFGTNAFWGCRLLKEVTLPSSLTKIADAFFYCTSLEVVNVPDKSQLKEIEGSAFVTNTALREFNFEGSCALETIGTNAFANLTNLQSFDFPASVNSIGRNAFSGCSSMTHATFADNAVITIIGEGAFADCGLQDITIPPSVKRIEAEAFRNCEAMTEVHLSKEINNIDPRAFLHCWTLNNISVDKDNTTYSSVDGYLLTADKKTLVFFPPGKANSNFTLLPPSITKIGDYAFYDCKNLFNVVIPNKVNTIGARAFGLCTNLNTVTFLCDEVIDPNNIDQSPGGMSFDDKTISAGSMFTHINTYVRREQLSDYTKLEYYQQFNVVGTTFFDGDNEYIPVSQNTVDLVAVGSKDYTFVVPTTATGNVLVKPGQEETGTYAVRLIGDYAFQNTTDAVKEVVVKQHVEYIGSKAFMTDIKNNTSTIEKVFFIQKTPTPRMLSTVRFELDEAALVSGENYNEFAGKDYTTVYVKKSALDDYKTAWKKTIYNKTEREYEDSPYDFTAQLDYKIPDVAIATKYSTFAREFDTDFSDYFASSGGRNDIGAFVAKKAVRNTSGDYGQTEWHVKMTSVDMHGGYSGSYGYVPAYTGVLLKVLGENSTDTGFYYTIGEQDEDASGTPITYSVTDNIMTGITVNAQTVDASETDPIYVIQRGTFHKVTAPIANFPVHRAYMKLGEEVPSNAKVLFVFDDGETTAIEGLASDTPTEAGTQVYNLAGQRVEKPRKGIYVENGRKIVVH